MNMRWPTTALIAAALAAVTVSASRPDLDAGQWSPVVSAEQTCQDSIGHGLKSPTFREPSREEDGDRLVLTGWVVLATGDTAEYRCAMHSGAGQWVLDSAGVY